MQLRILLLEDESALCVALKSFFGSRGHELDATRDVESAVAALAQRSYSAALADLMLDGCSPESGLRFIAEARLVDPGLPVVVLSACDDQVALEIARRLGIAGYLQKPSSLGVIEGALLSCARPTPEDQ